MNIVKNEPVPSQTFFQFLLQNRRNKIILYLAVAAIFVQFTIFKYLYPFANYIHADSFYYLIAADWNSTIDIYPIGYSKFLRLVSVFAKPDFVLVSIQYLMIQCSTLFLLFSIFYFYKANKVTQAVLFSFMVVNPLFLHLGNLISSDGIFLALSITWFALLLWIIYKPSNKIIFLHAIVLFAAFTVRYNALIYPFIALVTFGLSKLSIRKKIIGLGLGLLLIGWFVGLSLFQYKKLTGYWQFSAFSGWLLANNAMNIYRFVDSADRKPVPLQFRALDNMIRTFYDTHPNLQLAKASTEYMWTEHFPLMQYRDNLFKTKDTSEINFKKWASMGALYSSYGFCIIKMYPWHFLRYFVWPNSGKYFSPPIEYLEYYNWGKPIVHISAKKWFGYTNNQVYTRMKSGKVWILQYYPFLISIINLVMLLMLLSYLLLRGWLYSPSFDKCILLAGLVCILNAGFIIFTCAAALRFQSFPTLISVTISLLLIDWLAKLVPHLKHQNRLQQPDSKYSQKVSA